MQPSFPEAWIEVTPGLCEGPGRDVAAVHGDSRHALPAADGEVGPSLAYFGAGPLAQKPANLAYRHKLSLADIDVMCLLQIATSVRAGRRLLRRYRPAADRYR